MKLHDLDDLPVQHKFMMYKLCDKYKYHIFLIFTTYLCCWNWCKVTVYSKEHVLIRSFAACRLFSLLFHQGIWAKCRIRSKSSKRFFSTQNLMKHQKVVPPLLFHQREKSAKISKNEKRWLVSHLLNKFCTTSSQMFSRFLMSRPSPHSIPVHAFSMDRTDPQVEKAA